MSANPTTVYTSCLEYPSIDSKPENLTLESLKDRLSSLGGVPIHELQLSRLPKSKDPGYLLGRSPTHRIVAYMAAPRRGQRTLGLNKPNTQSATATAPQYEEDLVNLAKDLKSAMGQKLSDSVHRKSLNLERRRYPRLMRGLTKLLDDLEKASPAETMTEEPEVPELINEALSEEDDNLAIITSPRVVKLSSMDPVQFDIPSVGDAHGTHIGDFVMKGNARVRNGDVVDQAWKDVSNLPQNSKKVVIGKVEASENCRVMNGTAFMSGSSDPFWD